MRISDWSSDVCSSDLRCGDQFPAFALAPLAANPDLVFDRPAVLKRARKAGIDDSAHGRSPDRLRPGRAPLSMRSEEHTSELQSLMRISYAVFCLKKKNISNNNKYTNNLRLES